MIRTTLLITISLMSAAPRVHGCTAFIDALVTSPTGAYQRTGRVFFHVDSDCFALASPENPIYIRVGFDRNVTLSETLVDPFDSGPLASPIHLAARLYTFNQPNLLNKVPDDAMSIIRWRRGESAFWLKVTSSSSTWINDGNTTVPPANGRYIEFFFGHSAWESQGDMATSGFTPNMERNTRANGEPASTFVLVDINQSGLVLDPDPALSHLNHEIQAMDAATSGVTTEPSETNIQFGAFLPHILFPDMMFPRVCAVVRDGDLENIVYADNFPDKNFRAFLMHRFTFLSRAFARDQTELHDFPGLLFGIPLPIRDLTGIHFLENLEILSCIGEPIGPNGGLVLPDRLRHLRLERNGLTELPELPPTLEEVTIAYNPLREVDSLVAVSGLGTESHHRIELDHNLLLPPQCANLTVLEDRANLSGASISYGLQGEVYGAALTFNTWPNNDITLFIENMAYALDCSGL